MNLNHFFIHDCDERGFPVIIFCKCGEKFSRLGIMAHRRGCKK